MEKAVKAVVKDYTVDKQGEVEKMADDILAAIASLEKNTPAPTPTPDQHQRQIQHQHRTQHLEQMIKHRF